MVRTGHYNGVPLYADTTVEPYSVVLVPVTRGLLQPYERRRRGDLAGTTGSRAPAFPVAAVPEAGRRPMAAAPPTAPPQPPGAIGVYTPDASARVPAPPLREVVGTAGAVSSPASSASRPAISARRPESNDGIWIRFRGERWVHAGPPVPLGSAEFVRIGEHAGVAVYARPGTPTVIYLPTSDGTRAAPYQRRP